MAAAMATLSTTSPAWSGEKVEYKDGLDREQAAAVFALFKEDLMSSFESHLEMRLAFEGKDRIQLKYEAGLQAANVALSETRPAMFVFMNMPGFCGSGGCSTEFLVRDKGQWRRIGSSFGCTLFILDNRTNGLRDILQRCEKYGKDDHILEYDGREYVDR